MIIINIIILYFIQITHTDDFPSTGTRLVISNSMNTSELGAVLKNASRWCHLMGGVFYVCFFAYV